MENKARRIQRYLTQKESKAKIKKQERKKRKKMRKENGELTLPIIKYSLDISKEQKLAQDDTKAKFEEVQKYEGEEEKLFSFAENTSPKVLITSNIGIKSQMKKISNEFIQELLSVFPDSVYYDRRNETPVSKVTAAAYKKGFTSVLIVHQDERQLNSLTHVHLPEGPTAYYRLTNVTLQRDILGHGNALLEKPEVILNNFDTDLGLKLGRMLFSLFPRDPNFKARQVVTFHNQRDFIFFTRHRYMFASGKEAAEVKLQEIGPRFTLKLKALQKGCFDKLSGEFEWKYSKKYAKRRRYFI